MTCVYQQLFFWNFHFRFCSLFFSLMFSNQGYITRSLKFFIFATFRVVSLPVFRLFKKTGSETTRNVAKIKKFKLLVIYPWLLNIKRIYQQCFAIFCQKLEKNAKDLESEKFKLEAAMKDVNDVLRDERKKMEDMFDNMKEELKSNMQMNEVQAPAADASTDTLTFVGNFISLSIM